MNENSSVTLTGKDAAKLLEGLTKDPQLRSEDDPSILAEEQFPTDHHALLQGKTDGSSSDNIITSLRWEKHHTPHLSEEQKVMLTEQKNKTAKLVSLSYPYLCALPNLPTTRRSPSSIERCRRPMGESRVW
jgi:hypothetical protein